MSAVTTGPVSDPATFIKKMASIVSAAVTASDPQMWKTALTLLQSLLVVPAAGEAGASPRQLTITVGLPGSGKSTRALAWVAEDPARRARVNRDDLRRMLQGGRLGTAEQEAAVTAIQHPAVRALLDLGYDVVADDTNLTSAAMHAWQDLAAQAGAHLVVWDFTDVDVEECVRRDAARTGPAHLGETVIRRLHAAHLALDGEAR